MRIRFLLGPAGSGKTFRCLAEIRAALNAAPEGPPLIFLAPKQATFQLERQLLADAAVPGFTRLRLVSFERLAAWAFEQMRQPLPEVLTEEGRVMVLRALLTARRTDLKLFHASARLPGFARQLSLLLRELRQHQWAPRTLDAMLEKVGASTPLGRKLHDVALLVRAYDDWLRDHALFDADALLDLAADALAGREAGAPGQIAALWLDGFAQMTPQERRLLKAVVARSESATLAFCLEAGPSAHTPWHSPWSLIGQSFQQCHYELAALPGAQVEVEVIPRRADRTRFSTQPALSHLERHWTDPKPWQDGEIQNPKSKIQNRMAVRAVRCPHPEAEATLAAREILRFVHAGGRFREAAVLVRQLDGYHDALRRVFSRYGIPFFLDRREPVAHHPLAELTRCSLRTVAFGWRRDDWFGALKSGLMPASDHELDWLENEARARGWEGAAWQHELKFDGPADVASRLETLRQRLVPPFNALGRAVATSPTGQQLAAALRDFWSLLDVEERLHRWSEDPVGESTIAAPAPTAGRAISTPQPLHATVWEQMNAWLDNLALAFPRESLPLAQWLPILEAGLGGLTVGVIPPALDQVLIGAVDRSRNPDLRQVFILGANESVFPAPPAPPRLLTETDRAELERHGRALGPNTRGQLGLEQFYGYIACTRAREAVTLTCAAHDADGTALNPSPFIAHLQRLFPGLVLEEFSPAVDGCDAIHPCEVIGTLARRNFAASSDSPPTDPVVEAEWSALAELPTVSPHLERLRQLQCDEKTAALAPATAAALYGPVLKTSVSRLEQFAMCPFRFFVNSGLQAEERLEFELDVRQRGSFQHEVLAAFHEQLQSEAKRWRDLTPAQARARIADIAARVIPQFEQGLLLANHDHRFAARSYTESLQQFVGTVVEWMAQYDFDPAQVELGFGGKDDPLPAWELELLGGRRLALRGRIDRIDTWRDSGGAAWCVVIDYKSSFRRLDPLLMRHGVQQQLPAYLSVLRGLTQAAGLLNATTLIPAGVFYVNLLGDYETGAHRNAVLTARDTARKRAYAHQGLFDLAALRQLDKRAGASAGDQFPYRLTQAGEPYKNSFCALTSAEFVALLDQTEPILRGLGERIFHGDAQVDPYRKGHETPCDSCLYPGICRIDPWTHPYRALSQRP